MPIQPLFVRETFYWTPVGAGLILLPLMCPCLLGPLIRNITDKHGPRWYSTTGFVLACPALVLLRQVRHYDTDQKALLYVLFTVARRVATYGDVYQHGSVRLGIVLPTQPSQLRIFDLVLSPASRQLHSEARLF